MRICFFNRTYYPDFSATGQLLTELCEDLVREHGCEVFVVAGPATSRDQDKSTKSRRGVICQREKHGGVEIFRTRGTTFGRGGFVGRFTNYLSYFFSAFVAGLRLPSSDVVVALTDPPIIGLAALAKARRTGARFVFLCQDVFPEVGDLLEDFHSPAVNRILQEINRFLIRKADRVIALGESMRERLLSGKGAEPERVVVIPNWADCQVIVPGSKRNAFSVANHLTDHFVVMHSGNMGLSQNLENLIDAAGLLRSHPDIVVALVGDGVKRPALETKVHSMDLPNVRFFPYQPKEGLKDSFATADVFIVSLKKGLAGYIVPSKLYGILAAGRPFVGAVEEGCEVAAVARNYDCGLIARPGDAEDLTEKILTLYQDRALALRLGKNARRAGLEFNRRKQVASYHALFRDLSCRSEQLNVGRTPVLKRAFDISVSSLGLLFSSPLWLLIALAVKLEDGGPVFYAQERVGRGGRPFKSWKFRSMVPGAGERFGPVQAKENDPRVTRVGSRLRATAIDELPQLWNIFRGDMSFVGPRALATQEVESKGSGESVALEDVPGYRERHAVTPGLTGIAQVFAARDIPRRQKFRYDRLYVRRRSFWLDLRLIAISFWITFRGKWEERGQKF